MNIGPNVLDVFVRAIVRLDSMVVKRADFHLSASLTPAMKANRMTHPLAM